MPNCLRLWELNLIGTLLNRNGRWLPLLVAVVSSVLKTRAALQLENIALRHQIGVLRRSAKKRSKLTAADRLLWVWLSRIWPDWRVLAGHREAGNGACLALEGVSPFWTSKIRRGKPGRPAVPREVRDMIRRMSRENRWWGAPRFHGELLKLGIDIGETSVSKYVVRSRKPHANMENIPRQPRKQPRVGRLLHRADHPVSGLIRISGARSRASADCAFRCHRLSHCRIDRAAGQGSISMGERSALFAARPRPHLWHDFVEQVKAMGINRCCRHPARHGRRVCRAPDRHHPPRVSGYVIVLNERSLCHHMQASCDYYHRSRTHLALQKDSPEPRAIQPPEAGRIISIPQVGGLHHRDERQAA
jgi:putative transposase